MGRTVMYFVRLAHVSLSQPNDACTSITRGKANGLPGVISTALFLAADATSHFSTACCVSAACNASSTFFINKPVFMQYHLTQTGVQTMPQPDAPKAHASAARTSHFSTACCVSAACN